jgi:hypothetical protein
MYRVKRNIHKIIYGDFRSRSIHEFRALLIHGPVKPGVEDREPPGGVHRDPN